MIYESHCSSFLNRYGQKQRGYQISPVGITNSHLYSELGVFDCLHLHRPAERKRIVWEKNHLVGCWVDAACWAETYSLGKKTSGWLLSGCSLHAWIKIYSLVMTWWIRSKWASLAILTRWMQCNLYWPTCHPPTKSPRIRRTGNQTSSHRITASTHTTNRIVFFPYQCIRSAYIHSYRWHFILSHEFSLSKVYYTSFLQGLFGNLHDL
jgi:hypothetical protein